MTVRRTRSPRGSGEQLRGEIIDAAALLLEEHDTADAVSIRSVAQAVGVSSPAIYLHFTDKEALLDAVCGRYFDQLDDAMERAQARREHPLDRTLALGRAYVEFAIAHPAAYRFAFGHADGDRTPMVDEALHTAAFVRLTAAVHELTELGWYPDPAHGADARPAAVQLALEMWTVAHGAASLMIAKPDLPWGDDLQVAESVMRAACLGRGLMSVVGERMSGADAERFVDAIRSGSSAARDSQRAGGARGAK